MKSGLDAYLARLAAELRKRGLADASIVEEARGYLTDATEAALQHGLAPEEAERDAIARFGDPGVVASSFAAARYRVRNRVVLLFAVIVGVAIAYVDSRPRWDDTGVTAFVLLLSAAVFALIAPQRPWLWALAVGVWIPVQALVRAPSPGSLPMLVVLAFPVAGAYAAVLARRMLAVSRPAERDRPPTGVHLREKTKRGYRMPHLSEPEARAQLVPLLERFAPGMRGPSGTIETLTLLEESTDAKGHMRRYRAVFGNGAAIICTIVEATDRRGRSVSLEPAPE